MFLPPPTPEVCRIQKAVQKRGGVPTICRANKGLGCGVPDKGSGQHWAFPQQSATVVGGSAKEVHPGYPIPRSQVKRWVATWNQSWFSHKLALGGVHEG